MNERNTVSAISLEFVFEQGTHEWQFVSFTTFLKTTFGFEQCIHDVTTKDLTFVSSMWAKRAKLRMKQRGVGHFLYLAAMILAKSHGFIGWIFWHFNLGGILFKSPIIASLYHLPAIKEKYSSVIVRSVGLPTLAP